ncbi:MAG: type II secretion system minor pseudopilin GspH [Coxiellaceae bacterium]|nr:MAG: type II secretion system minor pseudopilin GspH [Coxiellaceae bacterium]
MIRRTSGFTLIEIMVVIVIIGILIGTAMFTLGGGWTQRQVQATANDLVLSIAAANQQALLQSRPLGLMFSQRSYQYFQFTNNQWQSLSPRLFVQHSLAHAVNVRLEIAGTNVALPVSLTTPAPQILFSPTGDITPFRIYLGQIGRAPAVVIEIDANGKPVMTPMGAKAP